jgi:hypothetical protein
MKKASKGIALLLGVLMFSFASIAQDQEFLRGKVLDQKTGEPVVFATVRILGKAKGVITNMDGSFRLPLEYWESGESIAISSMGYENKEYELQQLSPKDVNIIYLDLGVLGLSEVVVNAKKKREPSARQIVLRAIKAIPQNYPTKEFSVIGYYRDYQIDSLGYVNLNEAIIEVNDAGFDKIDTTTTKASIYDYRQNRNFRRDSMAAQPYNYKNWNKVIDKAYLAGYGGNEFAILRVHDAIRNYKINSFDFVNTLEHDFIGNHYFKIEKSIVQDGEQFFVISFRKSHNVIQTNIVVGSLYISKTDYAIHKLEYAVYDIKKRLEKGEVDKHGVNFEVIFEVITEYQRNHKRMFSSYISFFNTFTVLKPPKFIVEDFTVNYAKVCFVVKFNDLVDLATGINRSNYDVRFKGKKISFREVRVLGDKVELYPKNDEVLDDLLNNLQGISQEAPLRVSLQNIKNNSRTAIVNKKNREAYKQYREFFVQEVKPNVGAARNALFMKKDLPLFGNQPISKPVNFEEYWMNTPLPSFKE